MASRSQPLRAGNEVELVALVAVAVVGCQVKQQLNSGKCREERGRTEAYDGACPGPVHPKHVRPYPWG
jgi:hypothetical protein